MTSRLFGLLLTIALAVQQPAMAGRVMLHHGAGDEAAAGMAGHVHPAPRNGGASLNSHSHDCGKVDAACGACCAAAASYASFLATVIPTLRPEPVPISLVQPDLAAALDPPRS
jgi:hypothetical protein